MLGLTLVGHNPAVAFLAGGLKSKDSMLTAEV